MYTYVIIYIYECTHTYLYIFTYTNTLTHTHTYTHPQIHPNTNTFPRPKYHIPTTIKCLYYLSHKNTKNSHTAVSFTFDYTQHDKTKYTTLIYDSTFFLWNKKKSNQKKCT